MATRTTKAKTTEITSASAWKKKAKQGRALDLPSGFTCRAKNPGIQVFIREGLVPNDLLPIVNEALAKGKGGQEVSASDIASQVSDGESLQKVMEMIDAVTVYCVLEPTVSHPPTDDDGNIIAVEDRDEDEDVVYIDEVDFDDKMFIYQWAVGGTSDLKKFREQQDRNLESLQSR